MSEVIQKHKIRKFQIFAPGYRYKWWQLAVPMTSFGVQDALLVSIPTVVGLAIDNFVAGRDNAAWPLILLIAAAVIFFAFNELVAFRMLAKLTYQISRDWRSYTGNMIRGLGTKTDPGEVISVVIRDSKTIAQMAQVFPDAFASLVVAIVGTVQLWQISPRVAIFAILGIIGTILVITLISKALNSPAQTRRDRSGQNASRAADVATSLRTITGLGAAPQMLKRYRDSAIALRKADLSYKKVSVWMSASRIFLIGLTTLVAVVFALWGSQINGVWVTDIEPGKLVAVAGTVTLMVGPIWVVEMFWFGWRNVQVSLKKVEKLSTLAQTVPDSLETATAKLVKPQSAAAVVYVDPRTIGLSAQEYSEKLTAVLRQEINATDSALNASNKVLLSQSNALIFAGSLAAHLQLGTAGLQQRQMLELLEITDSLEIAHRLGGSNPQDFLQSHINSEGSNLSGGQRQRLALARALAQNVHTLVLAEPLNSVDEPSQRYIYEQLESKIAKPGPLEHIKKLYIVSTTAQVCTRFAAQTHRQGK